MRENKTYKIRLSIILIFFFAFFVSCRKERLNKDYEKVLIGEWKDPYPSYNLISFLIEKNGNVTWKDLNGEVVAEARLAKLQRITGESSVDNTISPQIKYYFYVKFKKRNCNSKFKYLSEYDHILYSNGEFDSTGNFLPFEKIIISAGNGATFLIYSK